MPSAARSNSAAGFGQIHRLFLTQRVPRSANIEIISHFCNLAIVRGVENFSFHGGPERIHVFGISGAQKVSGFWLFSKQVESSHEQVSSGVRGRFLEPQNTGRD